MRGSFRHQWHETIRSLWFLPAALVAAALSAGYLLSRVEVSADSPFAKLLFKGNASAARELLVVVSGTMITVTGLVFVLTVIALQIASTQFSPRLLRSFLQDPGTRLVLGVFVATFAYSLSGLFEVGQDATDGDVFVPQLAVTGALGLALLSVGMLVYYIQHITNSIQIDTVMLRARRATVQAVRRHYAVAVAETERDLAPPQIPRHATEIAANRSGYLQAINIEDLHDLSRELGAIIRLRPKVGDHVVAGTPLGWVWSDSRAAFDSAEVSMRLCRSVMIAPERLIERDVGIGVRQLIDIALRATAPSVNDPYTAVQAVQHLSIVMAELATVATDDVRITEGERTVVFVPVPDFDYFLTMICTQIRRSASDRPRVLAALLELLETVAMIGTSEGRRVEVSRHIELILREADSSISPTADLEPVIAAAEAATGLLGRGPRDLGDDQQR